MSTARDVDAMDPSDIKACCAAAYGSDVAFLVLGDSYHPGGASLTRRLARAIWLNEGSRVLDVASGPGTTALLLAAELGVRVLGVDLAAPAVEKARRAAQDRGLGGLVRFEVADAERLPVPDGAVDAVVCECALCTFPDKRTAIAEMARVVRPGGRIGITDVTLRPERLDRRLQTLAGWIACLADARPMDEYAGLLEAAGLRVLTVERHDDALLRMVDVVEARLLALRMAGVPLLADVDPAAVRDVAGTVREAIAEGIAGYCLLAAERGA